MLRRCNRGETTQPNKWTRQSRLRKKKPRPKARKKIGAQSQRANWLIIQNKQRDEQNSKSEYRNPKYIRMTQIQTLNTTRARFEHLNFRIRACFGFRTSDFLHHSSFVIRHFPHEYHVSRGDP